MIIWVNYAHDYSDCIRGTDDVCVRGPSGWSGGAKLAAPRAVADVLHAFEASCAPQAASGGLVLCVVVPLRADREGRRALSQAAGLYSGGSKPYGYARALWRSRVRVLGLVAVLGTQYTQALRIDLCWAGHWRGDGSLSLAVPVGQHLRDIPTDIQAGKITLPGADSDTLAPCGCTTCCWWAAFAVTVWC